LDPPPHLALLFCSLPGAWFKIVLFRMDSSLSGWTTSSGKLIQWSSFPNGCPSLEGRAALEFFLLAPVLQPVSSLAQLLRDVPLSPQVPRSSISREKWRACFLLRYCSTILLSTCAIHSIRCLNLLGKPSLSFERPLSLLDRRTHPAPKPERSLRPLFLAPLLPQNRL